MPSIDTFEATGELREADYVPSFSHPDDREPDLAALKATAIEQAQHLNGNGFQYNNGTPQNEYDHVEFLDSAVSSPMDPKSLAFDEFLQNGSPNGKDTNGMLEVATASILDSSAVQNDIGAEDSQQDAVNTSDDGLTVENVDTEDPSEDISLLPETCFSPRCTPGRSCYAFSCPHKTSTARLPFIAVEPEENFSMLPSACYSPRCTTDNLCYSFLCPNRAQQEKAKASKFSFMPSACYSPKCAVGAVEVCYAHSCPNREKQQSFRSAATEATPKTQSVPVKALRPRSMTRSWTSSYSVSRINGPKIEEETAQVEEAAEDSQERSMTPVLQVDGEPMPEDASLEPPATAKRPTSPWATSYSVTTQAPLNAEEAISKVTIEEAPLAEEKKESEAATIPRPWTPSYSVTRQEPSTSQPSNTEVPEVAQTHVPVVPEADAAKAPVRSWTPSYSVTVQQAGQTSVEPQMEKVAPAVEVLLADTSAPKKDNENSSTDHPPSRPWTPSYSVHNLNGTNEVEVPEELTPGPTILSPTPRALPVKIEGLDAAPENSPSVSAPPARPWTPSYSVSTQGTTSQQSTGSTPSVADIKVTAVEASGQQSTEVGAVEPPARPWTPSYSVSHQGKPAPKEEKPLVQAEQAPRSSSPFPQSYSVTDQLGAPRPVETEPKSSSQTWTPSYSVSTQGSSPPVELPAVQVDGAALVQESTASIGLFPQSYSVTNQLGTPRVAPVELEPVVEEVAPVKVGWTRSYSVSSQGSPAPRVPVEEPQSFITFPSSTQGSVEGPRIEVTDPTNVPEPATLPASDSAAPKRNWTRSYSVHSQGSVADLPAHIASASESSQESPADPSTPVMGVDNLPDPEVGKRYWPAWFSASKTDLHEEPVDAPVHSEPAEKTPAAGDEVDGDGKGCVIM